MTSITKSESSFKEDVQYLRQNANTLFITKKKSNIQFYKSFNPNHTDCITNKIEYHEET